MTEKQTKYFMLLVELLGAAAGAHSTWIASVGQPVIIRLVWVALIDGAWLGFYQVVASTKRREIVERIWHAFFLVAMTAFIVYIAWGQGGVVGGGARLAIVLLVIRQVGEVVIEYIQYQQANHDGIRLRWEASKRTKEERITYRQVAQSRIDAQRLTGMTTRISIIWLFWGRLMRSIQDARMLLDLDEEVEKSDPLAKSGQPGRTLLVGRERQATGNGQDDGQS